MHFHPPGKTKFVICFFFKKLNYEIPQIRLQFTQRQYLVFLSPMTKKLRTYATWLIYNLGDLNVIVW